MNKTLALTPALSHPMGEGESSSVCRRIVSCWSSREPIGNFSLSPLGGEGQGEGDTAHISNWRIFPARL
jgi:hypothetical protein